MAIAYAERGRCEAAVVYDPERDAMFHARRDQGAGCEHRVMERRRRGAGIGRGQLEVLDLRVEQRRAIAFQYLSLIHI